ncbi:cytochrome c [Ramlibacter sp. XY19]|uniref:c-type cytochrome n=1 Tax=Ramlibacter paludis TaxID=2908000 RepID=UPI0023DC1819|nr:cytochrome c [Ramlibacter paludis]MCG2593232.1 cytochrome c [Ramlibacter paludis]
MRKGWKIAGGIVAGLVLLAVVGVFAGLQLSERKQARRVAVQVQALPVAADASALERGRYLFTSRGCVDCHGANGAGRVFVEKGDDLRIKGPNITRGSGGVTVAYRGEDWVRAIRHGVAPDGRPLMVMPSEDYNRFTDADLSALVAYVQSLPPAAGTGAEVKLPLPARVLYGFGAIQDAAAKIDHNLPPAQAVAEGVNVQHGAYVANMCLGCHGPQLAGGKIPGGPPDWPAAADLTPSAEVMKVRYADPEAFIRMFKSGQRSDGSRIQVMPFESLRNMSDTDLRALHLYLKSRTTS